MAKGAPRRRTVLLAGTSALAHLVLLALVVRSVPPPHLPVLDDRQRAVRVTLQPRRPQTPPPPPVTLQPTPPPPPRPAHLPANLATPQAPPPIPALPPSAAPAAQPPASVSAAKPSAAPASTARADAWTRLGRAILGRTGCADPDAAGLNAQERAACQDRVVQSLANARTLPLGLSAGKQAAFDRTSACQERYDRGTMPVGTDDSEGVSRIHGLGHVPSARECPPSTR